MDGRRMIETGPERYQPDRRYTLGGDPGYALSQQKLAFMVGAIALLMPVAFLASTLTGLCFYESISHFYYARFMGGVFVGAVCFIGAFLLAYRGENAAENRLASLAGVCAVGVALFPTAESGCGDPTFLARPFALVTSGPDGALAVERPAGPGSHFELFPGVAVVHYMSAALLFAFLAWYAFAVFTRVIDAVHRRPDGRLKRAKRIRNLLYVLSGAVIVLAMLAMAVEFAYEFITRTPLPGWNEARLTFWCETAAPWAFGLSWMVRGRFFGRALLDDDEMPARAG